MFKYNKLKIVFSMMIFLVIISEISTNVYASTDLGDVDGTAALVVVGDADYIAYKQNIYDELAPASLTKMLTALVILRAIDDGEFTLDTEVEVTESAIEDIPWDASTLDTPIEVGEVMTVEQYLYCILMESDAYSCDVMAEYTSGSIDAFVEDMNEVAEELGCENSNFIDATGYSSVEEGHYSCAWDLYLIAKEAMTYDTFAEIVSTSEYTIPATNMNDERTLYSTNWLLSMDNVFYRYGYDVYTDVTYEYALGIKTGTTDEAGHCLASVAEQDGLDVYTIILGAEDVTDEDTGLITRESFSETIRMDEWAFANFTSLTAFKEDVIIGSITVNDGREDQMINVGADETLLSAVSSDVDDTEITYEIDATVTSAPISEGDVVGTVSAYVDDVCIATTDLISMEDLEVSDTPEVIVFIEDHETIFLIGALILLIAVGGTVTAKVCVSYRKKKKRERLKAKKRRERQLKMEKLKRMK